MKLTMKKVKDLSDHLAKMLDESGIVVAEDHLECLILEWARETAMLEAKYKFLP